MSRKYSIPVKVVKLDVESLHLLVEATINKIPINLIIDTGASRTVFDKKNLEKLLSISKDKNLSIRSAGIMAEQIESKMAVADVFKLGKMKIKKFPVILIDLDAINKLYMNTTGKTIHGLLGSDFLMKMSAVIDYKKMKMILKNP